MTPAIYAAVRDRSRTGTGFEAYHGRAANGFYELAFRAARFELPASVADWNVPRIMENQRRRATNPRLSS